MKLNRVYLSISAVAAILMLGLFGGSASASTLAQSKTPGGGAPDERVHFVGRVDSISARGIAMTTRRGQVMVRVGDRTTIMVEQNGSCVQGTLRGIQVGRPAEVVGVTTTEPRVIDARGIKQCAPDQGTRVRIAGQVA